MNRSILFYLLWLGLALYFTCPSKGVRMQRHIAFEECRNKKQLIQTPFKTMKRFKKIMCVLLCLKDSDCISFSYFNNSVCSIFHSDIYSRGAILKEISYCDYHAMLSAEDPVCSDEDAEKKCGIDGKRQDAEWGDRYHAVEIDTPEEWKKVDARNCTLASHGGLENCTSNETRKHWNGSSLYTKLKTG